MTKKDVTIRKVNDSIYRQAKAKAASKGISIGTAVDEALANWVKESEYSRLEAQVDANFEYARFNWNKKLKPSRGKAVVIADGRLQGVFSTYEEARAFARNKGIALVFVVDKPPRAKEVDVGPELELQN